MRPFQAVSIFGLSAMFVMLPPASLQASAQAMDTVGPHSAYCGSWQNGTWMSNGRCIDETTTVTTTTSAALPPNDRGRVRARISGTITSVKGHLVTLQQSSQTLVINDKPALDQRATGRIAVGRSVVAHGYWNAGTFYATRVATS